MSKQGLTMFQKAQLEYLHFNSDFCVRNDAGNRWPPVAWRKMIDALYEGGYIDSHIQITQFGADYLTANMWDIDLSVLN